ncbi:hypothetical protein Krac_10241 [Ktedonobacter racemifer DSM 44963]|uniref:Uncharacterized protein n=1 Tax=Ktedonobacter racemifer DSM 44963 TaxID=485913 RepID=D6TG43_KTERA|nr:hypothetical protein Krac_10241 [Ktedonobacter racemifer DSM 44963]
MEENDACIRFPTLIGAENKGIPLKPRQGEFPLGPLSQSTPCVAIRQGR